MGNTQPRELTRVDKILHAIDRSGKGLEIGPSYNPVAPKREGFKVEIVDHLDQSELVDKYRKLGCPVDRIEPVDHVWHGESYADLTGKPEHYDWIIASHVVEHTPDLVGFLKSCEGVLAEDGVLSLVVPDQRYCFDYFRPFSGISAVVDAHLRRDTRPSVGTGTENELYMTLRGGAEAWGQRDQGSLLLVNTFQQARESFFRRLVTDAYNDYHVWCFTPSSLRLLIQDLRMLGLIDMHEVAFFPSVGCEFFVTLKKTGKLEPKLLDRLALLKAIGDELAVPHERLGEITSFSALWRKWRKDRKRLRRMAKA